MNSYTIGPGMFVNDVAYAGQLPDYKTSSVTNEGVQALQRVLNEAYSMRVQWMRDIADRRRDIDQECGYPKDYVNTDLYHDLYYRHPVASRVVEVLPRETWQVQPQVYEREDSKRTTTFEKAWVELGRELRGKDCWHQDERGNAIWEMLTRADILSGIGQYGTILVGINDNLPLEQPARRKVGDDKSTELLYLRTFSEAMSQITQYDENVNSPRYGQPVMYNLSFNDPREQSDQSGVGLVTKAVHWTRVIHLADNLGSSEIFGVERQRPVLNPLLDLKKLYGGSAEMYYKGAFPGLALKTQPSLGGEPLMDKGALKDMMELYQNGLQRYLALVGMDVESLTPQVVDPTPQIMVHIQAICIKLGIPMRIFMGSERGELASSQDDESWNERLKARQNNYVTPRIICPLVDRLIYLGVLPQPKGYTVYWPDLTSQSVQEKSAAALQYTQALAQYVSSAAARLVSPLDFFISFLGWDEKAAKMLAEKVEADNLKKLVDPPEKQPKPAPAQGNPNAPKQQQQDNKAK